MIELDIVADIVVEPLALDQEPDTDEHEINVVDDHKIITIEIDEYELEGDYTIKESENGGNNDKKG